MATAELRKCKECGKMFVPKGREKYCSDIHYRPCPICGTPVVAKYLSDPPVKCANCKGKRNTNTAKNFEGAEVKKIPKLFNFADSGFKPVENSFKFESNKDSFKFKPQEEKKVAETTDTKPVESACQPITYNTDDLITEIPETIGQEEFCELATGSIRRYIGKSIKNGFIPGHDYLLKVAHGEYTYDVSSVDDLTSNEPVDILIHYSSQVSIHHNFARLKSK